MFKKQVARKRRVWHVKKKLMEYPPVAETMEMIVFDLNGNAYLSKDDLINGRGSLQIHMPDSLIAMNSTDMDDDDGREMFFDDIIEFEFHDNRVKNRTPNSHYGGTAIIVETMNNGVGILYDYLDNEDPHSKCIAGGGGIIEDVWDDSELWTFRVIGNSHQNPKLLIE